MIGAAFLSPLCYPLFTRAIGNPDSTSIAVAYVFRDLNETGDYLFYCRYDVNYASIPSEDASDTFEIALYDAAGVVLIASRPLNYYQHNIISLYFSASEAATEGLVWETAYELVIRGNPAVFPVLTENINQKTLVLGAANYKEQTEFSARMLTEAGILQTDWGITLLAGDFLNSTGVTYFTYAIPGFSAMAPDIMYSTVYVPTVPDMDYSDTTYPDSLHVNQGPKLKAAVVDLAGWLGVSEDWMAIFLVSLAYLTTAGIGYSVTKDPGVAMMIGIPVIIAAAFLGVGTSMLTIVIATAIIGAVLFGIHFILGKFA